MQREPGEAVSALPPSSTARLTQRLRRQQRRQPRTVPALVLRFGGSHQPLCETRRARSRRRARRAPASSQHRTHGCRQRSVASGSGPASPVRRVQVSRRSCSLARRRRGSAQANPSNNRAPSFTAGPAIHIASAWRHPRCAGSQITVSALGPLISTHNASAAAPITSRLVAVAHRSGRVRDPRHAPAPSLRYTPRACRDDAHASRFGPISATAAPSAAAAPCSSRRALEHPRATLHPAARVRTRDRPRLARLVFRARCAAVPRQARGKPAHRWAARPPRDGPCAAPRAPPRARIADQRCGRDVPGSVRTAGLATMRGGSRNVRACV